MEPLDETIDHVRGSAAGRLIVEYADYECRQMSTTCAHLDSVELTELPERGCDHEQNGISAAGEAFDRGTRVGTLAG
jgi:hypothetical protein